ncbi:MAG: M48 family metallopeptidase [Clostridiales bacterium]|nr:M48 family metallopeptidase [Clostridiales bacterium]
MVGIRGQAGNGRSPMHPISGQAAAAPAEPYRLVRSKRKTLAIHITKEATVEVRAPLHMSKQYIDRFVAAKKNWIESRVAKRERLRDEKAAFLLRYGDPVWLCGKPYPIVAGEGKNSGFDGSSFVLPPGLPADRIKAAVVGIYRLTAKRIIEAKLAIYTERMNVSPAGFHITGAKTRWGSCSGKKSLNFSWRLMMAEEEVIDYVVVHELAHILELNHSPRFWAQVERMMPDYRARKAKLKQLQETLAAQDWD